MLTICSSYVQCLAYSSCLQCLAHTVAVYSAWLTVAIYSAWLKLYLLICFASKVLAYMRYWSVAQPQVCTACGLHYAHARLDLDTITCSTGRTSSPAAKGCKAGWASSPNHFRTAAIAFCCSAPASDHSTFKTYLVCFNQQRPNFTAAQPACTSGHSHAAACWGPAADGTRQRHRQLC